jgi:hypothetical protein
MTMRHVSRHDTRNGCLTRPFAQRAKLYRRQWIAPSSAICSRHRNLLRAYSCAATITHRCRACQMSPSPDGPTGAICQVMAGQGVAAPPLMDWKRQPMARNQRDALAAKRKAHALSDAIKVAAASTASGGSTRLANPLASYLTGLVCT